MRSPLAAVIAIFMTCGLGDTSSADACGCWCAWNGTPPGLVPIQGSLDVHRGSDLALDPSAAAPPTVWIVGAGRATPTWIAGTVARVDYEVARGSVLTIGGERNLLSPRWTG